MKILKSGKIKFAALLLAAALLAASPAFAKTRVMVYGDSNTFGWTENADGVVSRLPVGKTWPGVMAAELGENYEIVTEGLGGRTAGTDRPLGSGSGIVEGAGMNGAEYLPAALSSHMPLDLVVIMLGTNDMGAALNRSAEKIALDLGRLAVIVRKADWQRYTKFAAPEVLLVSPPRLDVKNPKTRGFYVGSLAKSEKLPKILKPIADAVGAHFMDAAPIVPFAEGADELHLTPENHKALGKAAAKEVRRIIGAKNAN